MSDRRITCRYLRRDNNQCTGEATDPNGEVLLCVKHLGRALELVQKAAVQRLGRQKPAIRKRA